MSHYTDLLRDPRWIKKREGILRRDDYTCRYCNAHADTDGADNAVQLEVHHFEYAYSGLPWDVPDYWLVTLCDNCHETVMKSKYRTPITGKREQERLQRRTELQAEWVQRQAIEKERDDQWWNNDRICHCANCKDRHEMEMRQNIEQLPDDATTQMQRLAVDFTEPETKS